MKESDHLLDGEDYGERQIEVGVKFSRLLNKEENGIAN